MQKQNIRKFLAGMGAELGNIDNSFQSTDSTGYRMNINNIDQADAIMRNRLGMNQQYGPVCFHEPLTNYQEIEYMQPVPQQFFSPSNREERINRFLGRTTKQEPQIQYVETPRQIEIQTAVKEALQPVLEALEDIAMINGIMVQRIEQLIKTVDPDTSLEDRAEADISSELSNNQKEFQEDIPEMEVYDPGVSMSVLDDEPEEIAVKPKKKNKK